jgi:hypothetical protein
MNQKLNTMKNNYKDQWLNKPTLLMVFFTILLMGSYSKSASSQTLVQAEAYTAMFGIQKEATTDAGGGQNVGYIDNGDWMTYLVTVPQTGTYTVNFRVAGWATTGKIELQNASNSKLAGANIPNTGGYQKWTTVAGDMTFNLVAGTQTLRIYAVGKPFNLNWFELKSVAKLTTIIVTPVNPSISLGQTQQFTAEGKDQFGNTMAITPEWAFSIGHPPYTVATMSSTGLFTPYYSGSYLIFARVGDIQGIATLVVTNTIQKVLASITVTPVNPKISLGETVQFIAEGKDQFGYPMVITPEWAFSVGHPPYTVATMSSTGLFTPYYSGSYLIFARVGDIQGMVTLTVTNTIPKVLTSITLTPVDPSISLGETVQFTAEGKDQFGYPMVITPEWAFSVGHPPYTVATMSSTGLFTPYYSGSYLIFARVGDIQGMVTLTVTNTIPKVLTSITVTPVDPSIILGETVQFTAEGKDQFGYPMVITPEWAFSVGHPPYTVATMSSTGLFTPYYSGSYLIFARVGDIQGMVTLTVKDSAQVLTSISVSPINDTITLGQSQQFTAIGLDQNGQAMDADISWSIITGHPPYTISEMSATGYFTPYYAV